VIPKVRRAKLRELSFSLSPPHLELPVPTVLAVIAFLDLDERNEKCYYEEKETECGKNVSLGHILLLDSEPRLNPADDIILTSPNGRDESTEHAND
jgi:hypothetical protein